MIAGIRIVGTEFLRELGILSGDEHIATGAGHQLELIQFIVEHALMLADRQIDGAVVAHPANQLILALDQHAVVIVQAVIHRPGERLILGVHPRRAVEVVVTPGQVLGHHVGQLFQHERLALEERDNGALLVLDRLHGVENLHGSGFVQRDDLSGLRIHIG